MRKRSIFRLKTRSMAYWERQAERYFDAALTDDEERALRRFLASPAGADARFDDVRAVMGFLVAARRRHEAAAAARLQLRRLVGARLRRAATTAAASSPTARPSCSRPAPRCAPWSARPTYPTSRHSWATCWPRQRPRPTRCHSPDGWPPRRRGTPLEAGGRKRASVRLLRRGAARGPLACAAGFLYICVSKAERPVFGPAGPFWAGLAEMK